MWGGSSPLAASGLAKALGRSIRPRSVHDQYRREGIVEEERSMKSERRSASVARSLRDDAGLVWRARQRTSEELILTSSALAPSYAAAISGNTPYAALPNGMTIVMRKCGTWGC